MAGLVGELSEASVQLHQFLQPGHDVTNQVAAAHRLAVDLIGCQDPGPELEIGELTRKGLGDVEAAAHRILPEQRRTRASQAQMLCRSERNSFV